MNNLNNKHIRCIMINPISGTQSIPIKFIENIKKKLIPTHDIFQDICDTMEINYGCKYIRREIVAAYFPENSYYSIFYQSEYSTKKTPHNKIASIITNHECYGHAYIVHFDRFNQLYDVDGSTFIDSYNGMRTTRVRLKSKEKSINKQSRCHIF